MDTWSSAEEDETSPSSGCPICKGAGFVHPLLSSGKPDFKRVIPCRCTRSESDKKRRDRLERYSNLGGLTRLTFESLAPEGKSGHPQSQEQFKRAYEAAEAFATQPEGWLVFIGPSGGGKTHLAAAIANERIRLGYPALFWTTPELLQHLRSTFNPSSDVPYDELFNHMSNTPLLVLDDLGTQSSTPWAKEKLDQLLNHRYSNQLPTVIVTSTPIDELEERIKSRLCDPKLCQLYELESKKATSPDYPGTLELALLKTMTFEKFDWRRANLPLEVRQNLEAVYRLALDFAKSPDGWLVLQGATGCGKTHLAAAIANYRLQAGKPVLFQIVSELLDHLRSTFSPESKVSYDQLFELVKNTPLLVLDDFGEQTTTAWAQEKLYQIINHRYNARLATVITTRYSLEEIDNPISSRFIDPKISLVFNIMAPDYRGDVRSERSLKKLPRRNRKSSWE